MFLSTERDRALRITNERIFFRDKKEIGSDSYQRSHSKNEQLPVHKQVIVQGKTY